MSFGASPQIASGSRRCRYCPGASVSPGDEADIYHVYYLSTWARLLNSTWNHLDFQGSASVYGRGSLNYY